MLIYSDFEDEEDLSDFSDEDESVVLDPHQPKAVDLSQPGPFRVVY